MFNLIQKHISIITAVALLMASFLGASCCSATVSGNTSEDVTEEQIVFEDIVYEEEELGSYVIENTIEEDNIYECNIGENLVCEAYTIEVVAGEYSDKEIREQLPQEFDNYNIDWKTVIAKYSAGTAIILIVGVVYYGTSGSTAFIMASPAEIFKEAIITAAMAAAINVTVHGVEEGNLPKGAVKKYAIEGSADGFLWGAITSVLRVGVYSFVVLKIGLRPISDGLLKVKSNGEVFDRTGNFLGNLYKYAKRGKPFYALDNKAKGTVQFFNSWGKEISTPNHLPRNATLALGEKGSELFFRTDAHGVIYKAGSRILPNIKYTLNGANYKTDGLGRIIEVNFVAKKLITEKRPKLKPTIEEIGQGSQKAGDQKGHLIARWFGGSNDSGNLVAMSKEANQTEFLKIEMTIAKAISKNGKKARIKIEVNYNKNSYRPDSFYYSYDLGNGMIKTPIAN